MIESHHNYVGNEELFNLIQHSMLKYTGIKTKINSEYSIVVKHVPQHWEYKI